MNLSNQCWLGALATVLMVAGCSEAPSPESKSAPAFSVFASGEDGEGGAAGGVIRRVQGDVDADPVVESLTLEPTNAISHSRMRAVAGMSGRWTSMEYSWSLNDVKIGGAGVEVVLPLVKTGDIISVEVVPVRGSMRGVPKSASVTVKNQPPIMRGLSIDVAKDEDRDSMDDVEWWQASPRAEDPDGDSVEFEYNWFVNGLSAKGDDEFFRAGDLARGDRLEVEVRAFDGRVWSGPARSGEVEVGNAPPTIVSVPPRVDARGQFRYEVRVEDPDGDRRFHFALREAPRGMQVDDVNGIVRWEPDTEQAGRHAVEIVVTDEGGAESTQSFSLALVKRIDGEDVGPAAPR